MLIRYFPTPAVFGGAVTLGLQTSCEGFWQLESSTGTDETGNGHTLTETGTPSYSTGVVGNALYATNSDYCTIPDASTYFNIGTTNDFSIQIWFYYTTVNSCLVTRDAGFGSIDWSLGSVFTSYQTVRFGVNNAGNGYQYVVATPGSSIAASTWHHVVGTWKNSTKEAYIYLNNTGYNATLTSNPKAISGVSPTIASTNAATIRIDQVGIWPGRLLSSSEVTTLYNSGSGLTWAQML